MIRDGKVAVLYSPSFGSGWTTGHYTEDPHVTDVLLFHPRIVQAVLDDKLDEVPSIVADLLPGENMYMGGADDLAVAWLPIGTEFVVCEYDGNESIQVKDKTHWITA